MASRLNVRFVVLIALLVSLGFGLYRLWQADWDPVGLAQLGTRFSEGDPEGTEGYDGQSFRDSNAIYIEKDVDKAEQKVPEVLRREFKSVELIRSTHSHYRGHPVREYALFICRGYVGP